MELPSTCYFSALSLSIYILLSSEGQSNHLTSDATSGPNKKMFSLFPSIIFPVYPLFHYSSSCFSHLLHRFPFFLLVYCSLLCVSLLPPKFSIYIHLLTVLFLRIFHFSPKLNFHPYAYYPFSCVSHSFRNSPFSCTCQFLATYLVLLPFPTTCVIFSFVLDVLCFRFQKLKSFGLPQIQVFNLARYLQLPNNFSKLL